MRARPRGKSGVEKYFHPKPAATPDELPGNTNRLPNANEFKHSTDTLPPMAPCLQITQMSSIPTTNVPESEAASSVQCFIIFYPEVPCKTMPTDSHNFFPSEQDPLVSLFTSLLLCSASPALTCSSMLVERKEGKKKGGDLTRNHFSVDLRL